MTAYYLYQTSLNVKYLMAVDKIKSFVILRYMINFQIFKTEIIEFIYHPQRTTIFHYLQYEIPVR